MKYFFKKAIAGILPDSIIYRPKQGFRTPVSELFKGPLADWGQAAILDGGFTGAGFLRRDELAGLLAAHRTGVPDYSNRLWTVLVLNLWHKRWIEAARPRQRRRDRECVTSDDGSLRVAVRARPLPGMGERPAAAADVAAAALPGRDAVAAARRAGGDPGGRAPTVAGPRVRQRSSLPPAFDDAGITPHDIAGAGDLGKLPILGREVARDTVEDRTAPRGRRWKSGRARAARWDAHWCSATSARPNTGGTR